MNKYLRIWIALVVALNPVVINQMCTYYIDWTLYTLLVIFLINMYLFFVKGIQRTLHIDLLLLFFIPAINSIFSFGSCCGEESVSLHC